MDALINQLQRTNDLLKDVRKIIDQLEIELTKNTNDEWIRFDLEQYKKQKEELSFEANKLVAEFSINQRKKLPADFQIYK